MGDKKERVAILQLEWDEALIQVLTSLTEQETDKLKHLLWVVDMNRDHCPKKQRSYFTEFSEIYMGDFFIEGDVVNQVTIELNELTKRKDAGSMERTFYLKKWLNKKFSG